MDNKVNEISSNQLLTFIISSQTGLGILTLPAVLAENTGHDGWISVIIGGALSTTALMIIIGLLKRYSNKSIIEINILIYGKYIGWLINMIFIIYFYFAAVLGIRFLIDTISVTILRLTSPLALGIFVFLPTVYLTWNGLKPICRFSGVILFIIAMILFYYLLVLKEFRFNFMLPVGEAGIGSIIKGTFFTSVSYLGLELTALVYPYVKDKENIMKNAFKANMISTIFFTMVVVMTTGVYGEHLLKRLILPIFSISTVYRAPVLERLDLFFISIWLPAMACSMRSYFFSAWHSINMIFKIKRKGILYFLFSLVSIFLSRIPKDFINALEYLNILSIFGVIIVAFLLISMIFSYINKRGVIKK